VHHAFASELAQLHRQGFSGVLWIHEGSHRHRVQMHRGLIRTATLSGRFDPLGQLLARRGRITQHDLRRSLQGLATTHQLQGELLREMGLVSGEELEQALSEQLQRRLLCLLARERQTLDWRTSPAAAGRLVGPRRPLHPYAAVWAHLRRLGGRQLEQLQRELGDRRVMLSGPSPLWITEGGEELATTLRRSTVASSLCTGEEPARRLVFLWVTGCLTIDSSPPARSPSPALQEARRAFHREALRFHPDRHPGASEEERAILTRQFMAVAEAYRRRCREAD